MGVSTSETEDNEHLGHCLGFVMQLAAGLANKLSVLCSSFSHIANRALKVERLFVHQFRALVYRNESKNSELFFCIKCWTNNYEADDQSAIIVKASARRDEECNAYESFYSEELSNENIKLRLLLRTLGISF